MTDTDLLGPGSGDEPARELDAIDLLDTRAGLALANMAWGEGASTMLRSVNDHTEGPWTKPTNPYSAAHLARIQAERTPSTDNTPEPDDREALAEAERRWPRARRRTGPDPTTPLGWLNEGMASGFVLGAAWSARRHPEPVKPSEVSSE